MSSGRPLDLNGNIEARLMVTAPSRATSSEYRTRLIGLLDPYNFTVATLCPKLTKRVAYIATASSSYTSRTITDWLGLEQSVKTKD